ncbi:MAG: metallophosphoesterase family protein, partial [Thermodesulfobacteriota bacterium]
MRSTTLTLFVGLLALILILGCATSNHPQISTVESSSPTEKFSFVVLGDPHIRKNGGQRETLDRIIQEINLLAPDFVVICGDLIHGPITPDSLVQVAWDYFDSVMTRFQMPVYKVIGNHDVWDEPSEQIYKERYGKLYHSFSHKGSHFIILDSQVQSSRYNVAGEQLQWLKKDLEENPGALHTFAFLHVPVWQDDDAEDWWRDVHPLLAKYHVDAVFAGHWHVYQKDETKDGVKYIITSGAGPRSGEKKHTGHFPHFLLATVTPQKVNLAVVKPGNIEPEDIVTVAGAEKYMRPRRAARDAIGQIVLSKPSSFPSLTEVTVPLANSLEEPLNLVLIWVNIPDGWEISPDSLHVQIPPKGTLRQKFTTRVASARYWQYPTPFIQGTFLLPDSSEITFSRSAALAQAYLCKKRKAPRIDADLSDWRDYPGLVFDRKEQVDFYPEFTWGGPGDLSANPTSTVKKFFNAFRRQ